MSTTCLIRMGCSAPHDVVHDWAVSLWSRWSGTSSTTSAPHEHHMRLGYVVLPNTLTRKAFGVVAPHAPHESPLQRGEVFKWAFAQ